MGFVKLPVTIILADQEIKTKLELVLTEQPTNVHQLIQNKPFRAVMLERPFPIA